MKALVLYDSFFGNTEKIARELAKALETEAINIKDYDPKTLINTELLVVGSPTRGFRPSLNTTAFLKNLAPKSLENVRVAAFDTRIEPKKIKKAGQRVVLTGLVSIFGYAAAPIAKQLVAKGGTMVAEPEGFYVTESEGPLKDGELAKARDFAGKLNTA